MSLTFRTLLLLIAVVLFVLAAIDVSVKGLSLAWLGMALFAASFLVPDTIIANRR